MQVAGRESRMHAGSRELEISSSATFAKHAAASIAETGVLVVTDRA